MRPARSRQDFNEAEQFVPAVGQDQLELDILDQVLVCRASLEMRYSSFGRLVGWRSLSRTLGEGHEKV